MKTHLIEPISLCFGVKLSIDKIKDYANKHPEDNIYCLGMPVHNELISKQLEDLGVKVLNVNNPESYEEVLMTVPENSVIVFSAHGHDKDLDKICREKSLAILDTICPIVRQVQEEINRIIEKDYDVIYIGKKNHPECYAVLKNAPKVIFWEFSSSFSVDIIKNSTFIFNQTTILKERLNDIYKHILEKNNDIIIKNTSCRYVDSRYEALKQLNHSSYDLVVVAGSQKSSNTIEIYNKAIEIFGKEKTLLVSKADDLFLYKDKLKKANSALLTSGTSAPIELINEIKEILTQF